MSLLRRDFILKPLEILFFQCNLSSHEFPYASNNNYCKSTNHFTCSVTTEKESLVHSLKGPTFWLPIKCLSLVLNTFPLLLLPVNVGKGKRLVPPTKIELRSSMMHGVFYSPYYIPRILGECHRLSWWTTGKKIYFVKNLPYGFLLVRSCWGSLWVGQEDLFSCQMSQSVWEHLLGQRCARVTMET